MEQDITIWAVGIAVIAILVGVFFRCVKGDSDD